MLRGEMSQYVGTTRHRRGEGTIGERRWTRRHGQRAEDEPAYWARLLALVESQAGPVRNASVRPVQGDDALTKA